VEFNHENAIHTPIIDYYGSKLWQKKNEEELYGGKHQLEERTIQFKWTSRMLKA